MKTHHICLFFVALFLAGAAPVAPPNGATAPVQVIGPEDLKPASSGIQGEEYLEKTIAISPTVSLPLRIDVTAKGNGVMTIANLRLAIYDDHDDGSYYEGGMLKTAFTDIDGDGFLDLVIRGRILYTGEKSPAITKRLDVAFLYLFDKTSKKFVCVYHPEGISIDIPPN